MRQTLGHADPVVAGTATQTSKAVLADLCRTLVIAQERVRLLTTARVTEDEARLVAGITAGAPLVLVTSAAHMSRAMMLFRGAGMDPAASPTDYLTPRPGAPREFHPASLYPSAESLCLSERALEYLGTPGPGCAARPILETAGPLAADRGGRHTRGRQPRSIAAAAVARGERPMGASIQACHYL